MLPCKLWEGNKTEWGHGRKYVDGKSRYVHRLSLCEYTGVPYDNPFRALHKCDNPSCYEPTHLYWGTDSDNMIDKSLRGPRHKMLKLTAEQAYRIKFGTEKAADLSLELNISRQGIYKIRKGWIWKHLKQDTAISAEKGDK